MLALSKRLVKFATYSRAKLIFRHSHTHRNNYYSKESTSSEMLSFYLRLGYHLALPKLFGSSTKKAGDKAVRVPFACWISDTAESRFHHMNNVKFLQIAEIARFRMLQEGGILNMNNDNTTAIIAEQRVEYFSMVKMFQQFAVVTTLNTQDDKWLLFNHSFDSVIKDKPVTFTKVQVKIVLKASNGKTIRPSEICTHSAYFKDLLT